MIAHLGMYDMPHLHTANDAFWTLIRRALGYGPDALTRSDDVWSIWQSPDLLFSQTCGYPYRARLHGDVRLIGTPDYGLPGCAPGYYCSVFIAHCDDPRGQVAEFDGAHFAYNEALSQSGWAAPVHHMMQQGIAPGSVKQSGGHANSAVMVAQKSADFAAIDAQTYMLIAAHDPEFAAQIKVIAQTEPTPGLPFITARGRDVSTLRNAVKSAIEDMPKDAKLDLRLHGLVQVPPEAYLAIPTPPGPDELLSQ